MGEHCAAHQKSRRDLDQNGILFLEKIMGKFINMNGTILQTSHEKKINHKNFKIIKL